MEQKTLDTFTTVEVAGNDVRIFTSFTAGNVPPVIPTDEDERVYYGVGVLGLTESQIKALSYFSGKQNYLDLIFNPSSERFYFAYRASYGALVKIVDENGFDVTDGFDVQNINFTMQNGQIVPMNIYYSNIDTTQTDFEISFLFTE